MDAIYPTSPENVPADLTTPGTSYRRHAWIAMLALLVFVALYLALATWFSVTAFRLLSSISSGRDDLLQVLLVGGGSAFLAVFMWKALVFIKRGGASEELEVTATEQPRLFAFLHRLADEARAPRPHRVYLSARVNAAVFYDLSIANLFLPSRKNLEIGLALVNVLNLGELKAVLAHEFGHFAQRTMAVGRWVYIAHQIAAHIVSRRDALDKFLAGLSRVDLRVAWIGWLLRLIVWSIRSLVELVFRGVMLAERALSREMEYQADLVAASLTGSDALVHALHKLGAADDAFARAERFAAREHAAKRPVADLFAVQSRLITRMREILGDPTHGAVPAVPAETPEAHRVFKDELAQPPQMWSTHPANSDRERNVKRRYIPAAIDERSAWELFVDAEKLRATVSARHFEAVADAAPAPVAESMQRLEDHYASPELERRYRGLYLARSAVRHARHRQELRTAIPADAPIGSRIARLYGDDLDQTLDRLRALESEHGTLRAVHAGFLTAPGGIVRWRGTEVRRGDLPKIISGIDSEIAALRQSVEAHHRECRSLHFAAAARLGQGWDGYHSGLTDLLHYAEHTRADLLDAAGLLRNTVAIVTADGNVSGGELTRLLKDANALQAVLKRIYDQGSSVDFGAAIGAAMAAENWATALGEFKLPPATKDNINQWMQVVDGWVDSTDAVLGSLESLTLRELLHTEERVAGWLVDPSRMVAADRAPSVPAEYPTLLPGSERKRQEKLGWWDRFQTADGIVAAGARLLVAGGIVGSVVVFADASGQTLLTVYNGFSQQVRVRIDDQEITLPPHAHGDVVLVQLDRHRIEAAAGDGTMVESIVANTDVGQDHYVYNIAGGAALVRWHASYGDAAEIAPVELGSPTWLATDVDHLFTEPPQQIQTKGGGDTRSVLTAISNVAPGDILERNSDRTLIASVARAHARIDPSDDPNILLWINAAAGDPRFPQVVRERLARNPLDIVWLRAEQDASTGTEHDRVCQRHRELAAAQPNAGDLAYLALRCVADTAERDDAILDASRRFADSLWIDYLAGHVEIERAQYSIAAGKFERVSEQLPPLRDTAAMFAARAIRAAGTETTERLKAISARSQQVANNMRWHTGVGIEPDSPLRAFALLDEGKVDEALNAAKADPGTQVAVTRLAALSSGASAPLIEATLAAGPDAALDATIAWPLHALALREGGDAEAFAVAARDNTDPAEVSSIEAFVDALRRGEPPELAHALLGDVSPNSRIAAYVSAHVLLGSNCPESWRTQARQLGFAFERPYMR